MHVRVGETAKCLRLGDGFRVDPQPTLFAELKVLLGEGCVYQGTPRPQPARNGSQLNSLAS